MIIYTANQGNSLTFGILFPESYLMANARNINVQIGGKRFEHTVIDKMVRVDLQSADTIGMYGSKELVLSLDDVATGVRKVNLGQIKFADNTSTFSNQSTNTGYNFTVILSLDETAIEVTDVLYEYVKGERGASAYEVAVNDGFEGSVSDWLLSLHGADGSNGIDGKSAYEVAVSNGFIGTEEQWLDSLKGADGATVHSDLEELNGDPNFQHITSEEKENLVLKPFATDATVIAGTNETAPVNSRGVLAGFLSWVGSKTFAALPTGAKTLLDSITELWTNKVDDLGGTIYHSRPWFTPVVGQSVTISADGLTLTLSSGALFTSAMVGARIVVNGIRRVVGTYTSTSIIGVSSAFPASMRGVTYTYSQWTIQNKYQYQYQDAGVTYIRPIYNATNQFVFGSTLGIYGITAYSNGNGSFSGAWDFGNKFQSFGDSTSFSTGMFLRFKDNDYINLGNYVLGFKKNSSGILEINDGNTAGVYRDLNLRNLNYTGALTNTSDERLKKNLRPVTDGLKKVIDISKTIRHYEFIDQDAYGSGVITSEIAQYLLELGFDGHVKQRAPRNEDEGKLFGWEYEQREIVDKDGNPVLDQEGNKTFETVVAKEGDLIYTVDSQALTIYLFPAIVELNDKITAIEERLNKAGL